MFDIKGAAGRVLRKGIFFGATILVLLAAGAFALGFASGFVSGDQEAIPKNRPGYDPTVEIVEEQPDPDDPWG